MEAEIVNWLNYPFYVCTYSGLWRDVGGIYIMANRLNPQSSLWVAQYIGETDSYRSRIPPHEMWNPAVRLGATHVHAMEVEREADRLAIERELIREFHPPLNTQHRLTLADMFLPGFEKGR